MSEARKMGQYKRVAASSAVANPGGALLKFICTTAGTLQLTEGIVAGGADIVSSMPVAAGTIYALDFYCPLGAWAVLGAGAIGTFVA